MIINIICMLVFACVVAGVGIFVLEHTDSNSIRAVTILGCLGLVLITGIVVFTNENYHQFLQNEEKKIEMCKNNPIEKTIYQDSEMETITIVQDRLNEVYYIFHTVSDNGSLTLEKVNVRNTGIILDVKDGEKPYFKRTETCQYEIHLHENETLN